MTRLRAAIVGAGLMGRWHAHAVRLAGATVVVVVDPDNRRAAALARAHGSRSADDLTGVLDGVDVVHVCTPTGSHLALVNMALAAGRHVLVEKPLAATAEDTGRLLTLAAERGTLLCPVHQFAWQPGVARLITALPGLGRVRHVDITTCSAGAADRDDLAADAVALEIVPHPLSLLARLLPAAVAAEWQLHRPAAGEYRLSTCADGATVSVVLSMAGRPTVNALRVIAERGTAHVNLFHGYAVIEGGAVSRARKILQPLTLSAATGATAAANLLRRAIRRQPAYPGLVELTRAFYQAAASGGPPPIAPAESLAIAHAVDAVRARAGVSLPIDA